MLRDRKTPGVKISRLFTAIGSALFLQVGVGRAETVAPGISTSSQNEVDDWLKTAAALNRPTMTDPAGSHGSFGLDIGAGISRHPTNPKNRVTSQELGQELSDDGHSAISIPKLWISKGTMVPIDFTLTGGTTQDRLFSNAGGIVQLTVFEARSLPAVSLRGFYGKTFGKSNTVVTSSGGEVALGIGFLRYIQGYITGGVTAHRAELRYQSAGSSLHLPVTESANDHQYVKQWNQISRSAGIKFTLVPGKLSLTAETTGFKTDEDSFNIRISTLL